MSSIYAPLSGDSNALRVVIEETVTIKIKAKRSRTFEVSVNCFLVKVRDL